jgi:hypothetical protein
VTAPAHPDRLDLATGLLAHLSLSVWALLLTNVLVDLSIPG